MCRPQNRSYDVDLACRRECTEEEKKQGFCQKETEDIDIRWWRKNCLIYLKELHFDFFLRLWLFLEFENALPPIDTLLLRLLQCFVSLTIWRTFAFSLLFRKVRNCCMPFFSFFLVSWRVGCLLKWGQSCSIRTLFSLQWIPNDRYMLCWVCEEQEALTRFGEI